MRPALGDPPAPRLRTTLIVLGVVRLLLLSLERAAYPFLPVIARGLGVDAGAAGTLLAARAFGGFSAPLTVAASRTGGHLRLARIGLGLFALGAVLVAVPGPFALAVAGFAVLGAARPAYDAAAQAHVADRTPWGRRGRALASLELMYAGGLLIGAPTVGWIIARGGWRAPFVAGAVGAAVAALALGGVLRSGEGGRPSGGGGRLELDREAGSLLAVLALVAFGAEASLVVLGVWLEASFAVTLLGLGGLATVIGAAELAGELVPFAIIDRLGKRRMVAAGLVVGVLGFGLLARTSGALVPGMTALAVGMFGFEIAIVGAIPLVSELRPAARAPVLATSMVAMAAGRTLGAAVGPLFAPQGGIGRAATLTATAFTAALVVLWSGVADDR